MKRLTAFFIALMLLLTMLTGCARETPQVVATTAPVYEFTRLLCQGTGITIGQLVTEEVSCLHDYTLQVSQMRMLEAAELVIISGAGLEEFLEDVLPEDSRIVDSSVGCHLHGAEHAHEHNTSHDDDHHHETDPHIWMAPENAMVMAQNICKGLSEKYPAHKKIFAENLDVLLIQLSDLQEYGANTLSNLSCRELITFHDGFAYFAESFDLTVLKAMEEESGSEASAKELKELVILVHEYKLPAVFTEVNGSTSAAQVICAETGIRSFALNMAMSGQGYFEAMYHNINTIKEALE